jgi:uncharacterized protein YkwD
VGEARVRQDVHEHPGEASLQSLTVSTFVAAALCGGADKPATALDRAEMRAAVACVLGAERAEHQRRPLQPDARLERGAQRHARDMADRGYFSHVTPGGAGVIERLRRAGYVGDGAAVVGEVLARGRGAGSSPLAIRDAWLASRGHRDVILEPRFEQMGIGVAPTMAGRGVPGVTVAVTFGRRR